MPAVKEVKPSSGVFEWMDEWGPEKILIVHDTRTGMKGMVVIDNTARGMGKGGCRMAPDVTLWDCFRLARTMTWKYAFADFALGGAKAAIQNDPNSPNKEAIIRAFVRGIRKLLPDEYVFGNDMGFAEAEEGIVLDECGGDLRVAVGTPAELGGFPYDEMGVTGYGVAECVEIGAKHQGMDLEKAAISIQGLGAVGSFAAKFLHEKGAKKIVAISSVAGTLYDPNGLDIEKLLKLKEKFGDNAVKEYKGGKAIPLGDELKLDVDILIPAAKGDVITKANVDAIKAKMIVEGANFPITPECREILHKRGVFIIPDFVANAGAVIAAGMSMFYRYSVDRLDPAAVYATIKNKMKSNVPLVLNEAKKSKKQPIDVALDIAKARVRKAMELKKRIPK
jgi:glutamate dehydrogenase (NAD(P)+)